jgi:hypothetical protein
MPGRYVAVLCRTLVSQDTFALMIAPALADLQFESRFSLGLRRVTGYIGIWRALAGAIAFDVLRDLRMSIGSAEWRASRRDDLSDFAWLVILQAIYYVAMLALIGAVDFRTFTAGLVRENLPGLALLLAATVVFPVLTVAACYWGGTRPLRSPHD